MGPIRVSLPAPPGVWVCWAGQIMKQQSQYSSCVGRCFKPLWTGHRTSSAGVQVTMLMRLFQRENQNCVCWGRMGDGNPTRGGRVPNAWKYPWPSEESFSSSRRAFNNSGLLDAALQAWFLFCFSQHTDTKEKNRKQLKLFHWDLMVCFLCKTTWARLEACCWFHCWSTSLG